MSEQIANGGRQIKLFLVDGLPAGIITAEVVNWTGKALSAPRSRLAQLIRREEAERTGIYVLMGPEGTRRAPSLKSTRSGFIRPRASLTTGSSCWRVRARG